MNKSFFNAFWDTFSAAPHRLFFFSGAVQLLLPALFWASELSARYGAFGTPLNTIIPATWAHGFLMIYGIFIFFIYGFLMTVFPRWMRSTAILKEHYLPSFVWLNAGLLIFEISLFFSRTSALTGLLIFLLGWLHGIYILYRSLKQSPPGDKYYERILLSALSLGAVGAACFSWFIYSDDWQFISLAFNIGIWLFLLPILFSVSHRMLPFFSSNVLDNYPLFQPRASLWLFIVGCSLHFLMEQKHLTQWLFLTDIPLAALALLHTLRWQIQRSFVNRLLAVLHMAFFWLFIGFSLFSAQSLMLLISDEYILNRAPLHAITIGFISSMLIAMASRVTLGHSGRPLMLDRLSWLLFLGLQLAAVSRLLADVQFQQADLNGLFNLLAVTLWLICVSTWFSRYAPMYLRKRIDDKPG